MKIFNSAQIRDIDTYTIKNEPIKSIDLMERAAKACSNWILNKNFLKKEFKVFVGSGNNGGDGLAIARLLIKNGYKVNIYILIISKNRSADCMANLKLLEKLKGAKLHYIKAVNKISIQLSENDIVIDAMFGSGLTRELEGFFKSIVEHINNSEAQVISIDIPSGLFCDNNVDNNKDAIMHANYTLSFQFPKLAFFFAENEEFLGEWNVLPIGLHKEYSDSIQTDYYYITNEDVKEKIIKRRKFSHKGSYGNLLLISGSYGKIGAAILVSKACLKSGCGLLTTHVPKVGYEIMQTSLPEAMISIDWSDIIFTDVPNIANYSCIGVGPGIGTKKNTQKALLNLLDLVKSPMVIDADAINIIAENKDAISKIPENSILTPHPKEFERIAGVTKDHYARNKLQIEFAVKNKIFVVLKGAHTSIACPDGSCYYNSTGNPGMATAGSGDVLTGVILSLLGQGYTPQNAAILGVYIHGQAGDIAADSNAYESVIASDIIDNIGKAFKALRKIEE
ncbi:MAG: NAD(P)H-hydrate dehydratase [Bacteroidales bacterium]|jgi:hydroxyethylthiazole kinase-like uncharacterized protein yjeF|nr:NAD(P)H-hydrate dehydratase [Bacteroidales bacterium]